MRRSCVFNRNNIKEIFRKLWIQHVFRTRIFISSTIYDLPDLKYVTENLLQNPKDFAEVFKRSYSNEKADKFCELLTEHLKIGGEIVNAAKNKQTQEVENLNKLWYENADKISEFLYNINSFWDKNKWRNMLYSHLDMTEKYVIYMLSGEYQNAINMFSQIEDQAVLMGDFMAWGISKQFCII